MTPKNTKKKGQKEELKWSEKHLSFYIETWFLWILDIWGRPPQNKRFWDIDVYRALLKGKTKVKKNETLQRPEVEELCFQK